MLFAQPFTLWIRVRTPSYMRIEILRLDYLMRNRTLVMYIPAHKTCSRRTAHSTAAWEQADCDSAPIFSFSLNCFHSEIIYSYKIYIIVGPAHLAHFFTQFLLAEKLNCHCFLYLFTYCNFIVGSINVLSKYMK